LPASGTLTPTYNILSTAELPATALTALEAGGLVTDVLPFIHIAAIKDDLLTAAIRTIAAGNAAVAFTSANAVAAVIEQLQAAPRWTLYVISGNTWEQAAAFFGDHAIAGIAANGRQLAAKIIADGIQELVFFCGDKRLDVLPETLEQQGIRVRQYVVYTNTPTPVQLTKAYEAVLFFSPTAAESFFSVNQLPDHVPLFAIGSTTAAALGSYCSNPVFTAARPSKASVAATAMHYFKEQQTQ
jgi:uroporphyrinogen-III synthase